VRKKTVNKVILDRTALATLGRLNEGAEVCDESGKVLGFFTPLSNAALYEGVDAPISAEELKRRSKQGGGRTLPAIMADLEKRS
jgi:hypothetical protein